MGPGLVMYMLLGCLLTFSLAVCVVENWAGVSLRGCLLKLLSSGLGRIGGLVVVTRLVVSMRPGCLLILFLYVCVDVTGLFVKVIVVCVRSRDAVDVSSRRSLLTLLSSGCGGNGGLVVGTGLSV